MRFLSKIFGFYPPTKKRGKKGPWGVYFGGVSCAGVNYLGAKSGMLNYNQKQAETGKNFLSYLAQ